MAIFRHALAVVFVFFTVPTYAGELKLAHFVPPTHPMDRMVMTPMAEAFNQAEGVSSEIRIFAAGELGKGPKQQYKRVATGAADIAFVLPAFTEKLFPVLTSYEIPGRYGNGIDATKAMWEGFADISIEVKRAVPLAVWANNPTILIMREKAVRAPDDLKGQKIRVGNSRTAQVITAWGGVPVHMSPTEAYQALSTGVVDGIYIDPVAFQAYKLYEVTKFATVNVPGSVSSFMIAMNKGAHARLTDAEKSVLDTLTGEELSMKAANIFAQVGADALKLAAEKDVQLITLNEAEIEVFAALSPFARIN